MAGKNKKKTPQPDEASSLFGTPGHKSNMAHQTDHLPTKTKKTNGTSPREIDVDFSKWA